jgi:hypothetical protein
MKKLSVLLVSVLMPLMLVGQISQQKEFAKRGHEAICLAYSPDGTLLATGGTDSRVHVWNMATGAHKMEVKTRKWPRALCFSPDGNYLITAGKDERLKKWNLQTGELVYAQKGHRAQIVSVDISPDGKYIATGGADGKVILWDFNSGSILRELRAHRDNVNAVCFHPGSKQLATGSADKYIIEWSIPSGNQIRKFKAHKSWIRALAYSPDGTLLASAGDDKNIIIWKNGVQNNSLLAHRDWIQTLAFSPDGHYLLSGGHDKYLILWELPSGKIKYKQKLADKVMDVLFSPDGKTMAAADFSYKIPVWHTQNMTIKPTVYLAKSNSLVIPEKSKKKQVQPVKKTTATVIPFKDNPNRIPLKGEVQDTTPAQPQNNFVTEVAQADLDTPKETEKKEATNTAGAAQAKLEIDVDMLPQLAAPVNPNRYALIIGNEDYSSFQLSLQSESNVDFAVHDATIFKNYAKTLLGIPEENIIFMTNARAIEMHRAVNKINMITGITGGNAEIFFYYAGHGLPDEKTKEPYIMPVDVGGADLEFALSLREVYEKLTEHPTKQVTVLLDACFSGGARNQGLVAARGVKIQPQKHILRGNIVVFSASSGNETSLPYHEKKHGIFTYYLLKKLKDTKGQVSYREMSDYLYQQVGVRSVLINSKKQTPATNISVDMEDKWQNLRWVQYAE